MQNNISFIIIGRNEGWKLSKCISSIIETVKLNAINNYEIIYVDSKSTDDSIERAKAFTDIKIFKVTGQCNAAVARNIGAKESTGNILFFIDGDMEINHEFLIKYPIKNEMPNDYFTGHVIDIIYDEDWKYLDTIDHYRKISEPTYLNSTGGIFIIAKELWSAFCGMRTKYTTGEDLDLSLRLSRKGHKVLRMRETICNHHTIPNSNEKRMWSNIFNFSIFYSKAVLFRDHLFDRNFYQSFLRHDYSFLVLMLSILLSFVNLNFIFVYIFVVIIRTVLNVIKHSRNNYFYFFSRIAFHVVKDILILFSFIFFHPSKKNIEYERVN